MLDYPAIAALAAVAFEGSFERAAARLGITPSAVSQRVRGLEERVGAVLVTRGQPCRATPIGMRLCAHVDQVRLMEDDVLAALPLLAGARAEGPASVRIALNSDSLATWFAAALSSFVDDTGSLIELVLDDEEHTSERLRAGEVVAAVSADRTPVQGCRHLPLGRMHYAACASPTFVARHFPEGVTAERLDAAPALRFDRRDHLQSRWVAEVFGAPFEAPTHWVPSAHGFVDFALAGLGWGMHAAPLVSEHLATGRLVELLPGRTLSVSLFWHVARLQASRLDALTRAVRDTALQHLSAIETDKRS